MNYDYDYVIVGAGPSGLTLAWYLANYGKKILLIEREKEIGGCHRVQRVNGLFTEHGPRIIVSNYFSLKDILKQIGLKFEDLYVPYYFRIDTYIMKMLQICTI